MSRYSQKDSRLGDVSELSVEWVPLPKLDEHSNATIKYIKPDGNEDCTIITRKNDEQHPLGWTVIAHPAINTNEGDEDPNIQVLRVTGRTVVWEQMAEEMQTLPDNRLDIGTRSSKNGNAFLVLTAVGDFGLAVFQRGKWIIYNDKGEKLNGPVKVLSVKVGEEAERK